ncbi:MAG: protein kinase [Vicinamibacteria bacterium]|nr:protein kinase [Vicinamibacteria bacterium]
MIGTTVSHYTILETLGRGGMGVVYKATDTRLGRTVALKFLSDDLSRDPLAVERFVREARAASGLNHPNVCSVHDIGEHEGRRFIVMEYLDGAPLNQRIGGSALPPDQVLELGIQIADALAAAHHLGLVHRDIKPANIFVTERGAAKLLDFGLAKASQATHAGATTAGATFEHLTSPGSIVGTVAYMSPEQVRGEPLDARTDIFSLGAVLYEMATGRQAFGGTTPGTIHDAILNRDPAPLSRVNPEIPARLDDIIIRALEKDRTLRYQNAADLRADLQRLRRDTDSGRAVAASSSESRRSVTPLWRRPGVLVAATVALVAVLLAASRFGVMPTRGDAIDSLAVLPFVNASGNPDTEYLSDGITESLIRTLSQFPSLRVPARSTVFRYKGKDTDPQQVGRDLGVRAVLSGRLLQRGDTLVLRTELVDVADGSQLWGGEYTSKAASVFELQDYLSREVSDKLRLRLTTEEKERLTKRYTNDSAAYQLYLQGRYHRNKMNPEGYRKAIEYLNQAVARDPRFALAYAGLADAHNQVSFFNLQRPRDVMPKAKEAAARALEIDPALAEAHISLGWASYTYDWDWPAAKSHFDQARALNAAVVDDHPSYQFYLTVAGRPDEAIRVGRQALARDPVSASLSHTLSVQLALAGRYDEAIAECLRTIDLDPNFAVAHEVLAAIVAAKGDLPEALRHAEKAQALNPFNDYSAALVGFLRAQLGEREEALRVAERLETTAKQRYTPALSSALVYAGLGDRDRAFQWLDKAYDERSNRLAYLGREPVWQSLRSDPRFAALLARIGLPK